jgi:hypothetical protein
VQSGHIAGTLHASIEAWGRNRPKSPILYGSAAAITLMLQIIKTRIISVVSWYHLAFFVISIVMFGLTAGAAFVYLRRERFRPERLSYDLTVATLAFALTTISRSWYN